MKKRVLSIVMMCLMVFLLTACGNNNDDLQSNLKTEDVTREKMSEALENHKLWFLVEKNRSNSNMAKDDRIYAVYTFEDGRMTVYSLYGDPHPLKIGELKGMSDEEIIDMLIPRKMDNTPVKYTLSGETDDTGNFLLTESIGLAPTENNDSAGDVWYADLALSCGRSAFMPCYNGHTIYDTVYNGFWDDNMGHFFVTRMKGGEPAQPFVLDDVDTKGIEVD